MKSIKGAKTIKTINGKFKNKKVSGFSFIEVLVVVMVVGILVGASLPAYLWTRDDARTRKKQATIQRVVEAKLKFYNAEKTAAALSTEPTLEQIAYYITLDPTEIANTGTATATTNIFFSNHPECIFKKCFPNNEVWELRPNPRGQLPEFVKTSP